MTTLARIISMPRQNLAKTVAAAALVLTVALPAAAAPMKTAIFAGGCFWSVEHAMEHAPGVRSVVVGYTGGASQRPTYQRHSDHLEAVRVTYDPAKTSYGQLADYFLRHIDPTDVGGQICDRGHSYTSAMFAADPADTAAAQGAKARAGQVLKKAIAVKVLPESRFWLAEDYHQDYADKNPMAYNAYRIGCGRDARIKAVWSPR
jgi:peptide-methionine (S)-S-oxide reductase